MNSQECHICGKQYVIRYVSGIPNFIANCNCNKYEIKNGSTKFF